MYRRQKVLIELVFASPRVPSRLELTKWAFLLKQETVLSSDNSFYSFVPYRYGPFSFTIYRDIDTLVRYGYLDHAELTIRHDMVSQARDLSATLPVDLRDAVASIMHKYGSLQEDALIDQVYSKYPWYASRSEIRNIKDRTTAKRDKAVYTLGYEGESIDQFLYKILKQGIQRIIDVRNNPLSRKYGFSKGTLMRLCGKMDIDYVHLPELGIPSANRRSLQSDKDYKILFDHYEKTILPNATNSQRKAVELLSEKPSALVCFEKEPRYCHRNRLANRLSASTGLAIIHV